MTEITYLETPEATVTNTRAVLKNVTYAMANITSVRKHTIEPDKVFPIAVILVITILGLSMVNSAVSAAVVGIGIAALVVGVFKALKPSFVVVVGNAGNEAHALTSNEEKEIDGIVDAITEAIIDRG